MVPTGLKETGVGERRTVRRLYDEVSGPVGTLAHVSLNGTDWGSGPSGVSCHSVRLPPVASLPIFATPVVFLVREI